jgi:hypothetical protein
MHPLQIVTLVEAHLADIEREARRPRHSRRHAALLRGRLRDRRSAG